MWGFKERQNAESARSRASLFNLSRKVMPAMSRLKANHPDLMPPVNRTDGKKKDFSAQQAGWHEEVVGERDILEWLYALATSDQASQFRPDWFTQVTHALEQFFHKFCCGDLIQKHCINVPESAYQVEQLKMRMNALQVELCQILYLLKHRGPASDMSTDWLRNEVSYCLRIGRQFEEVCGKPASDVTDGNNPEEQTK
jgi:hypothetical protein